MLLLLLAALLEYARDRGMLGVSLICGFLSLIASMIVAGLVWFKLNHPGPP